MKLACYSVTGEHAVNVSWHGKATWQPGGTEGAASVFQFDGSLVVLLSFSMNMYGQSFFTVYPVFFYVGLPKSDILNCIVNIK